jgi:outer membrane receptor for ferric coprogen and ferric-rhodotorulic acid
VRHEFPNGVFVQAAWRGIGETFFNEANQRRYRQGSYGVFDAEVGFERGDFSIAVFARNLFDREFFTFMNPQIDAGAPGDPQTFGVRVGIVF